MDHERTKNELKKHVVGGEAFLPITKILEETPYRKVGIRPAGLPYSIYELLYHIHFTQRDILEYLSDSDYAEPKWPLEYWPKKKSPDNEQEWRLLIRNYLSQRKRATEFIEHSTDVTASLVRNPFHTELREILLIIEHTAYHTGQLMVLARLLNAEN